jgi:hypothetical protein
VLRHGRALFIVFLLTVVWSERMTLFWAARFIVVVTVIAMLRQAAAAGPLLWINPTTGGGAAWGLGLLKAWLGICRFELAGALVARQCGCACPALHHLRRHGRTALSTNIEPKVGLVLAAGRLQGQPSLGRLGLVTLATLVVRLGLRRLGSSKPTEKRR